jgi:ATP-binding cassette subfamily F protein 3
LVEALTAYSGAVILVSHDMHLLGLVADRLWLVQDGRVMPYEDDLETYRNLLLTPAKDEKAKAEKKEAPKPKVTRDDILKLRAEVRKAEERMEKLAEVEQKVSNILADPTLYEDNKRQDLEKWNRKYAEVTEALPRAEALWLEAATRLEDAEAQRSK